MYNKEVNQLGWQKLWCYFMVVYWAVVLVLTFMNQMMLSMDLMAIGMFAMAVVAAVRITKK